MVGVYYFPQYHQDPRNDQWHGTGWTEWDLVRHAEPRFPGHQQPKVPLWGYYDEADPLAASRNIETAKTHAIDFFIYDWYFYEDGPFLEAALQQGYLKATNAHDISFALMWANHPWRNVFPAKRPQEQTILMPGAVTTAGFVRATDHAIEHFLCLTNYARIGDAAYFSIFDAHSLIAGIGGLGEAGSALRNFRDRARAAGVGELHLNAVLWELPGTGRPEGNSLYKSPTPGEISCLGFDSVTSYNWFQYVPMTELATDYADYAVLAELGWEGFSCHYPVPYIPNVSMGWDPSPRTVQSDNYSCDGYPYTSVLVGNTPEAFAKALSACRAFVVKELANPVLTINAWNEWTEGSYLEPDEVNGMAYLKAVKEVFGTSLDRPASA